MEPIFRFFICALVVFRLAEMLAVDDGPFEVFIELRGWLGHKSSSVGAGSSWFDKTRLEVYKGISCVYCAGVWLSFLITFFYFFQNNFVEFTPVNFLLVFLALAGLQSIFATKLGRN